MNYKIIRDNIEDMVNDNHRDFVKAVISMEKGVNDEIALDKLYDFYMENDSANLLNEEFDVMIEKLRKQGQVKDIPYIKKEKDELVDIVGNIAGKVDVVERENKKGESFKVVNFSVVSNDSLGNKVYHNCSAYGEKGDIPKNFKQGDFVKIFGQVRISVDGNGKEYRNVNILSSRILKAKERMDEVSNSQETATLEMGMKDSTKAEKESVRKIINKYKDENKGMAKLRKEIIKDMRDKYFIDQYYKIKIKNYFLSMNIIKYIVIIKTRVFFYDNSGNITNI